MKCAVCELENEVGGQIAFGKLVCWNCTAYLALALSGDELKKCIEKVKR